MLSLYKDDMILTYKIQKNCEYIIQIYDQLNSGYKINIKMNSISIDQQPILRKGNERYYSK